MADDDRVLIAFDGECLMCSRSIRFLARRDVGDRLRFTPLQSEVGQALRESLGEEPPDSMLVRKGGRVLVRSEAVLAVLGGLALPWRMLAGLGSLIPRMWRDRLYDFIAARRHKWFGKGDACALPSEALQRRLVE